MLYRLMYNLAMKLPAMTDQPNRNTDQKEMLHPRNKHRDRYDFPSLIKANPQLSDYVSVNPYGDLSVDFKDPDAVKALNQSLLKYFYGIELWDIPKGYLCPPIPGRADYLHYLADLLAEPAEAEIPTGKHIKILDIGVGANCIYPLIGHSEYGWTFVGSETDSLALKNAKGIVDANLLSKVISIRKQSSSSNIFSGVIRPGEKFDATICNPPFHASRQAAMEGSGRKWKNLRGQNHDKDLLNFGGQNTELWCEGGEERFVRQMIKESLQFSSNCRWFTSLISKKETLPACYRDLSYHGATAVKTINMSQGQKKSRILAWTFQHRDTQAG
ncbi:23S rRNA m(6)A-1618 methyltransferase [Arcticibacter pallidicorallinus]|uniref:Ribosomal RNA large subunit methyltransferase F n=2 Tax=Arcticibacter pallidicorallinus TaxID=1259464 RepID=A0A2T0U3V9_9SPHI|nr:23S rRNA m(6)A-1618 methyltransferase [Arcticibacter pallidicorallinus]